MNFTASPEEKYRSTASFRSVDYNALRLGKFYLDAVPPVDILSGDVREVRLEGVSRNV